MINKQKGFVMLAALAGLGTGGYAEATGSAPANYLEKRFPTVYRVTQAITVAGNGLDISRVVDPAFMVVMSLPNTNDYQDVTDLTVSGGRSVPQSWRRSMSGGR